MEVENSGSGLYKPPMGADGQTFDEDAGTLELPDVDQCCPIHDMDDLQLVGVPVVVDGDSVVGGEDAASTVDVEVKAEVNGGGKRKRGRPPRGQPKPPPLAKSKNEEEDVCFICFDGGSLVLCDRRGCPKAYHPTCIKRDEAFFRSKARWNCGWHICSICQKAAHFMCYTCTYSLCKGCTKDADYVCVRGDKGFCTTCMRTVMLIENNERGSNEMAQVDFDDKSSWEYLFKVYWIYLKEKLSLTLTELAQAKNPLQGAGTTMVCKGQSPGVQSPGVHRGTNDGKRSITNSFSGCLETNTAKRRKTREQPKILNKDSLTAEKTGSDNDKSLIGCTEWATKELLEFVSLMKNGDTSVLSQFDVQALLLDYVKINNLRDPHRKSQIICDLRLKNMFGKPRVGHFEMLKLLEFHFFIKEEPQKDVFIQAGVADAVASQVEADGNNDNLPMMIKDKKRKTRRKGEERAPQTNLDEYAAIDVHNINLIYLRRNLMESLLEENEKFHAKVTGSIVRIRISSGDQKQDMYRLVQVVGTTKVAVPYKIGNKTTDAMLKVLNLDKKEDILIDAISNQDFSEEECRRLRQSIRCGLVKRLTVGEILEKAMALQSVKLNDWLETEIMRLSHLRDRASEKGRKKELRECVEKIQLLKTPEERQCRLREIPEVHSDPNMDPNYQSEEDAGEPNENKQGEYVNPRYSAFGGKGGKPISQRKRGGNSTTFEQRSNICTAFYPNKEVGATKALERVNEGKDAYRSNSSERRGNEVNSTGSEIVGWNNQAVARSLSFARIASETSTTLLSKETTPSANNSETDKLWHYRDPNGKIQGPFSMVQLQKWSTTGYFPPDMRIWTTSRPDDSLLLTDALNGQLLYNISLQTREVGKGHRINPNHGNSNSHGIATAQIITGGQSNVNQSNTQGSSGQSSGQNWKFFPNNFNSDSSFACVTKSTDSPEQNGEVNIQDLPSPTPKTSNEDLKEQPAAENKPSVPSKFPVQDSGPSGSSASSLVVGGAQLPEIADEWGGYSPTPLKPSVEAVSDDHVATPTSKGDQLPNPSPTHPASYVTELKFSTLAEESVDLLAEVKPSVEAVSDDHVATPTSKGDQLPYSSPTHPASYVTELIEFSTLAEESVSDLLAEVDAMESQGGLASPTSVMNCSDDFIYNPKDDCFSSIEEFSPTPDPGKSDALSSTGDIQLPSQSTITDEPVGASRDDVFDPVKRSSGQSSPSTEVDGNVPANQGDAMVTGWGTMQQSSTGANVGEETKPTYVSCGIQQPAPFTMRQDKFDTDIADRAGSEVMDIGRDTMQGSSTRAKAEGETKPSDVSGNQEGSSLHLPAPFTLRQDFVDTDIAHRAGSEDVDTGWGAMNQSSTRAEVGGETQSADVFVNREEAGSSIHPSAPFATSQYMVDTNVAQRVGSEDMDIGWATMQGNINLGWGRSAQGNMNHSALSGSLGWENQRKNGGERFTGPTDRVFQGGLSAFSRANKNSWGRQSFGGAGGGGNSRSPSKGQRVCKFYESGHCKKGASCSYLHP